MALIVGEGALPLALIDGPHQPPIAAYTTDFFCHGARESLFIDLTKLRVVATIFRDAEAQSLQMFV